MPVVQWVGLGVVECPDRRGTRNRYLERWRSSSDQKLSRGVGQERCPSPSRCGRTSYGELRRRWASFERIGSEEAGRSDSFRGFGVKFRVRRSRPRWCGRLAVVHRGSKEGAVKRDESGGNWGLGDGGRGAEVGWAGREWHLRRKSQPAVLGSLLVARVVPLFAGRGGVGRVDAVPVESALRVRCGGRQPQSASPRPSGSCACALPRGAQVHGCEALPGGPRFRGPSAERPGSHTPAGRKSRALRTQTRSERGSGGRCELPGVAQVSARCGGLRASSGLGYRLRITFAEGFHRPVRPPPRVDRSVPLDPRPRFPSVDAPARGRDPRGPGRGPRPLLRPERARSGGCLGPPRPAPQTGDSWTVGREPEPLLQPPPGSEILTGVPPSSPAVCAQRTFGHQKTGGAASKGHLRKDLKFQVTRVRGPELRPLGRHRYGLTRDSVVCPCRVSSLSPSNRVSLLSTLPLPVRIPSLRPSDLLVPYYPRVCRKGRSDSLPVPPEGPPPLSGYVFVGARDRGSKSPVYTSVYESCPS